MQAPQVRFGDWFQRGFDLYRDNFGVLVGASLVALLLSLVTLGILSGPMYAGLILIALRLVDRDEPKPEFGDLFKGFELFLQSFLFWLVWSAVMLVISFLAVQIPCVGFVLSVVISVVLGALLLFGMFLIADRKMDFWSASMKSIETVGTGFFPFLAFAVATWLVGAIGSVLCVLGAALTMPIAVCAIAVAYRDVFGAPAQAPPTETVPPEDPGLPEAEPTPPQNETQPEV